jgi:Putative Ig domain
MQTYSSASINGSTTSGNVAFPTSLVCPAYGKCVGAGIETTPGDQESAVVMVENGAGQWSQPVTAPLPANAATNGAPVFGSVACSSATACVAVGAYPTSSNGTQPFALPFTVSGSSVTFGTAEQVSLPGNALATNSQTAFLSGVSCGSGGCTAVGTYKTSASTPTSPVWAAITATPGASGAWTATAVTAPTGATNDVVLNAISCPSTGACEAVGTYADGSGNTQSWAVQVSNGAAGAGQPVTIPGAAATADSAPEPPSFIDVRVGLAAISCPSAGVCTAAGTVGGPASSAQALLLPISSGTPGQSSILSANGSPAYAELDGISCSDASDCTTVGVELIGGGEFGNAAIAASETGGSWSAPVTLQGSSTPSTTTAGLALGTTVACTSPGVCVTAGLNIIETSTAPETGTEGSFFAYSAVPPTITTSSLPAATVGLPYSATLQSSGGTGSGSWAVTLGALPAGLTLNSATGVISGTPTANGQNGFVVTTTNTGPPSLSSTVSLSITVGAAPTVTLAYSKISGHSALIVFSCSGAKCAGAYKLTGVEHLHGKKPTAVDAKAKQHPKKQPSKRTVTLASGHYSINPGGGKAIVVKLNGTGAKLLRKLHKISGQLTLTPTGSTKPALIKTLKFRS